MTRSILKLVDSIAVLWKIKTPVVVRPLLHAVGNIKFHRQHKKQPTTSRLPWTFTILPSPCIINRNSIKRNLIAEVVNTMQLSTIRVFEFDDDIAIK